MAVVGSREEEPGPRSGHLGAAWEVALVVVFLVVFGTVIGVTVYQVRKRKARRERRRARRAARANATESPTTLTDDKTSTASTKATPSSERKRGFFDPFSSEEDDLTTEDEESSIGGKKQSRKTERRTSSRRSGSRRQSQTVDRAPHSGSERSIKRGRTKERVHRTQQQGSDEKIVDAIVTIEEEGYVSEDEGQRQQRECAGKKQQKRPTPSVRSEKSRPTSPVDQPSKSKDHDPSLDLEAGPARIPKPVRYYWDPRPRTSLS